MISYYDNKLNQINSDNYQKDAFDSYENTVVLAGPGSGKTTIITLKISYLLNHYIYYPRSLACMTFSNDAAKEFTDRLNLMNNINNSNLFLGTVHSFCLKEIIVPFGDIYKDIESPIKLISEKDKKNLILNIKNEFNLSERDDITTTTVDIARSFNIQGESKVQIDIDKDVMLVGEEYENRLNLNNTLDYTSIVKYATEIVRTQSYVRKYLEAKYPWILIDEYQDLGKPMQEIVLSLLKYTDIKFFIVGDIDQSIYSFQGAIPDFLKELSLMKEFKCKKLINNYRSLDGIIKGSACVLGKNRGYNSTLDNNIEAEYKFITCSHNLESQYKVICENIIPECKSRGIALKDICILIKEKSQTSDLVRMLESYDIEYYISKHNFNRSELIIWIEDIAKWSINKYDNSLNEIYDYYIKLLKNSNKLTNQIDILKFKKILLEIINKGKIYNYNLLEWVEYIINEVEIISLLETISDEDEIENLKEFLKELKDQKYNGLGIEYLASIGNAYNRISISTRHSSKGLEFEVVILVGMEEGNFPDYRCLEDEKKMEEEHRVCFVCISRAKKICYLLRSRKYTIYSKKYGRYYTFDKEASRFWNILMEEFKLDYNIIEYN